MNTAENTTHPVGTKLSNGIGIYDMSGNVFEWCWDIYGDDFPGGGNNPHGPDGGTYRVLRGGSCFSPAANCTVSARNFYSVAVRDIHLGFRCVRRVD